MIVILWIGLGYVMSNEQLYKEVVTALYQYLDHNIKTINPNRMVSVKWQLKEVRAYLNAFMENRGLKN